jgi:peptidoglycan/LPS O-acetylase OafA/YrhL
MKSIKYQNNLDILRGLAILLVVIYHLKLNIFNYRLLPGGYLGVDIFFVISGYLITSILSLNINGYKFDYANFFQRRFLRIVPVYVFVIFATLLFGYYLLIPQQLVELSRSSVSSIFFLSNIFFWQYLNDYYNPDAILNPLLHTWSLAIEIHFYLFIVLFFFIIKKFTKRIHLPLLITGLLSLLICQILAHFEPRVNFFGFQSRLWEFILGSFIFFYREKFNLNLNYLAKNLLYFAIILFAIFFNENTQHPSLFTLLFLILVSILILNVNNKSNSYSEKLLIFFGLISYSLYLWHYPILSLSKRVILDDTLSIKVLLFLFSVLMSCISYYLLEKKLKTNLVNAYYFVIFFIFASFALIFYNVNNNGYPERIRASEFYKNATQDTVNNLDEINSFDSFSKNNFLIIGNSHSLQTYQGFVLNQKLYKKINFSQFHIQISCFNEFIFESQRDICKGVFDLKEKKLFNDGKKNFKNSNFVILSTRWTEADIKSLPKVINFLKNNNKNIIIFSSIVDMSKNENHITKYNKKLSLLQNNFLKNKFPFERYLFIKNKYPEQVELSSIENLYYENLSLERHLVNIELKNIAKKHDIPFLDINSFICDYKIKKCKVITDKRKHIMYDTTGHFTADGSKYLSKIIYDEFVKLINERL